MIILTNPLLLEIVLGSSATTSQLPFYVAYVDSTSITYVPAQLNGLTNNTSIVTLVPTPLAGTSRTIKYVSIHNEDSVSSQVILQINDGVNTKIIVNFTLDSGDRLEYTDTVGFRCLTSTGEVKQGSGGGGTWGSILGTLSNQTDLQNALSTETENAQSGTSYTFALTDGGKMVTGSNSSPTTFTVPTNSSVGFPIGTRIDVLQIGTGKITIANSVGVTLLSQGGNKTIKEQYVACTLWKKDTDLWYLMGNLQA